MALIRLWAGEIRSLLIVNGTDASVGGYGLRAVYVDGSERPVPGGWWKTFTEAFWDADWLTRESDTTIRNCTTDWTEDQVLAILGVNLEVGR